MSGRGRGRGRGRAPPTGSQKALMESAEDCGYDARNIRSIEDKTRPQFFPDILLHSSGNNKLLQLEEAKQKQQEMEQQQQLLEQQKKSANVKIESTATTATAATSIPQKKLSGTKRSPQTVILIRKGRELQHRFQKSAFHVKATKDVPDIIRYSDSTKAQKIPKIDASTVLSNCLMGRKRTSMGQFVPEELILGQQVRSGVVEDGIAVGRSVSLADIDKEGTAKNADDEDEIAPDDGSFSDDADYGKDHYASDDDDSDGENVLTY